MIEIPTGLPAELVPLSWLLGVWEGTGVVEYAVGDDVVRREFGQRISFSHDGLPHLNYSSYAWGEGDDGPVPFVTETGYWRLRRRVTDGDPGPAMLPPTGERPFTTAEEVETLRHADGGFDVEVALVLPGGVSELYVGQVKSARIDLATDAVLRTEGAKAYTGATRLYGLVERDLLWAWDIAALGQPLRTHAIRAGVACRLTPVPSSPARPSSTCPAPSPRTVRMRACPRTSDPWSRSSARSPRAPRSSTSRTGPCSPSRARTG